MLRLVIFTTIVSYQDHRSRIVRAVSVSGQNLGSGLRDSSYNDVNGYCRMVQEFRLMIGSFGNVWYSVQTDILKESVSAEDRSRLEARMIKGLQRGD